MANKQKAGSRREAQREEAEHKFYLKVHTINKFSDWFMLASKFVGWSFLIYLGIVLPLKYTAGKQTIVNFIYGAALDLKMNMVVPWAAVALFGGLWQWERYLRKKTVAREHRRTEELEKQQDPNRTSSGLTPTGDDPKEKP